MKYTPIYKSFFETPVNYCLEEKLFRVEQDVDFIYNNAFKEYGTYI